jgi:hypothetical protein
MNHYKKYKNMTKIKITKKTHNRIFNNRQLNIFRLIFFRYEYLINLEESYSCILEHYSLLYKILATVLLPVSILFEGINNFSFKYIFKIWNDKKSGKFISDTFWKNTKTYRKMRYIYWRQNENKNME